MSNIPVHSIFREVRHPAWTPINPDGTTPAGTAPVANGWQPIGHGREFIAAGTTWKGDAGQMMTLSGYATQDTVVDHSGDGDNAQQMRSVDFEVPQTRSLSFIVPATWQWLARFLWTVFRDATKRPLELRETHFSIVAATAAVNNTGGYAAAFAGALGVDGPGAGDLAVGDLITFGNTTTVYRVESRTTDTITLDKPLAAAVIDNLTINRAARTVRTTQQFYVETTPQVIESKSVLKIDGVTLQPYDRATEEGMQ